MNGAVQLEYAEHMSILKIYKLHKIASDLNAEAKKQMGTNGI